ncbi:MAG: ArsA family ATPase [Angustibacter sp.]
MARSRPGRRTPTAPRRPPVLDIDALLADRAVRTIVCCGAGGVGKTTMAAALAVRAAESGRQVVVLTIDPARRLAQSLGLTELDNTPRQVAGVGQSAATRERASGRAAGRLDAMMLDMKRTFDEIVEAHAPADKAAQILANPFYQALSSSFAGTQEYMAMEKLGQLRAAAQRASAAGQPAWDLIVVDTPPSRSALDFLDAPRRLGSFLDGRLIRLLTAPARTGGRAYLRVFSAGVSAVTHALTKVLGAQFLRDVQTFVTALDTMFGGFRERADATYRLLQDDGTAFLVVATPERDALREAAYFIQRLRDDDMPLAGLVLNRVHELPGAEGGTPLTAERALAAAEGLTERREHRLTQALLRLHADRVRLAEREGATVAGFASAHRAIPVRRVRARATDVHDLPGLRDLAAELVGRRSPRRS